MWVYPSDHRSGPRVPARLVLAVIVFLSGAGAASARQDPNLPPPPPIDPNAPGVPPQGDPTGPQVLARGPIHEAFASPIEFNPVPGPVIPKPSPQTQIEEQPPDQKPQGNDVEWIPGYWAWDDERNDYIWVSGVWRDIPPGRQWVPGYWSQADGGFRWTPGFWGAAGGSAANGQFYYLPAPPPSQENGPNAPQPGENFAWAPGNWIWQADHYVWRPGYWFQSSPDWIWTPSSYTSTPSGYVYNDGFWDYSMNRRGLAFAPSYFGASIYSQPNYAYTPSYALPVAGLLSTLFVRPSYNSYYFGNYYGGGGGGFGARPGYVPWFDYNRGRGGYDPLYASMAATNFRNPNWDRQIRDDYRARSENVALRPAPTFAAQRPGGLGLVQPLRQWAGNPEANHRLVPVAQDHRAELIRRQADVRDFAQARQRQEFAGRGGFGNDTRGDNEPRGGNEARIANETRVANEARNQNEARLANEARSQNQARIANQARGGGNQAAQAEQFRAQRMELPRSPIASAREPRFQSPGLGVPPGHPEQHLAARPNFEGVPHRPMNSPQGSQHGARPGPAPAREAGPGRPGGKPR